MSSLLLKQFRENYRLSQGEMGILLGRSRGTISSWENGQSEPDTSAVSLLRSLHGKDLREIIGVMGRSVRTNEHPDEEASRLSDWILNSPCKTQVRDLAPESPEGRWDVTRGQASTRFPIAALTRLATVPMAQGGALVPEATKTALGPLALDSRLSRLGAVYIGADAKTLDTVQPVFVDDVTSYWVQEGVGLPESTATLRAFSSTYSTIGATLNISRRLLRTGGPAAMQMFARALTTSIARAIDLAALTGTGIDGQPLGLVNMPITSLDGVNAAGVFGKVEAAIELLELAGVDSERLAVITHPTTKRSLYAQPLSNETVKHWKYEGGRENFQTFDGFRALAISGYPQGKLLMGDFGRVIVRISDQLDVRILDINSDGSHSVFVFADVSIEVPYPASFVEIYNVV